MKKNSFFINSSLSYLKKGICSITFLSPLLFALPVELPEVLPAALVTLHHVYGILYVTYRPTDSICLNFKEGIISIDGGLLSKAV